ncbi:MAG: aminoacyl--tRNA ligase-related protein [Patescibacteria group bacterium]
MRQSQLFTKTRKSAPKDEVAKNAQLLIRGGFIHKEMAGVYDFLPLGYRVLENIVRVIREEMNAIGGVELNLSALQNPDAWQKTGRWDEKAVDSWFKTNLRAGGEVGLGFTHEEPLTALMCEQISSYKDLPSYPYQFQTKFRNEERAKSGLMRTREFLMKDLYSFSKEETEHAAFYEKASEAYMKIWKRVGLGDKTFKTFASGGSFSKFSHEFQTVCDAGEDTIYINQEHKIAINKEVFTDEVKKELGLGNDFTEAKAVEVGNIFTLGTRFSEPLGLTYKDDDGKDKSVFMGSYGIGPARVMATIVEVLSDNKGIVWPKEVAPFAAHLVAITGGNQDVAAEADRMYELLREHGIEVLYDDRDVRAGEKFADAELIGIPTRLVISEKTLSQGGLEVSERSSGNATFVSDSGIVEHLKN